METEPTAHIALTTKKAYRKRLQQPLTETRAHKRQVASRRKKLKGSAGGSGVSGVLTRHTVSGVLTRHTGEGLAAVKGQVYGVVMIANLRSGLWSGFDGKTGEQFTSFSPAISPAALKAKGARLREMRIHRRTDLTLNDLAAWLNPIVAGWMRYYGRYCRSALGPLLRRVSFYLKRWAANKYKATADPQTVPAVVDRTASSRARPIRPLAVDPLVLTAGEKSPVTGDCHAGIRGSRGLRCPRPPDHHLRQPAEAPS